MKLESLDAFDYLSVLLSIVIGLAITQVLLGFRGLILTRAKVKLYLPTLLWAALALLIAINFWWTSFGLHRRTSWTFVVFFVIILQSISTYMIAALVLPDISGNEKLADLRDHYYAHRSWFFGAVLANPVFSAAKELALSGHLPLQVNGTFHVIFAVAALAAMVIKREWFHQLLAPAMVLLFLLYVALLFARLY